MVGKQGLNVVPPVKPSYTPLIRVLLQKKNQNRIEQRPLFDNRMLHGRQKKIYCKYTVNLQQTLNFTGDVERETIEQNRIE